jgi:hypothetical protein
VCVCLTWALPLSLPGSVPNAADCRGVSQHACCSRCAAGCEVCCGPVPGLRARVWGLSCSLSVHHCHGRVQVALAGFFLACAALAGPSKSSSETSRLDMWGLVAAAAGCTARSAMKRRQQWQLVELCYTDVYAQPVHTRPSSCISCIPYTQVVS